MEQVGHVKTEEKMEQLTKPETESQVQVENEIQSRYFFDELPQEMLMKILTCLNSKTLVASRLVSRKWNQLAGAIIQSRSDVEIGFRCRETADGCIKIEGAGPTRSLENFVNCFKESKDSPLYTGFRFNWVEPSLFEDAVWLEFISKFGQSVKCLKFWFVLDFWGFDELTKLTESLRELLLNQLPNLQELGLWFPYGPNHNFTTPEFKEMPLFPATSNGVDETTTNAPTPTVQLPQLKTLFLDDNGLCNFTGIITDLLCASANLQKIQLYEKSNSSGDFESLCLLQSLGKLHCLQNTKFPVDAEVLTELKENPSFPLAFKLKKLSLVLYDSIFEDRTVWPLAALFLSNLFESSKDTLSELEMPPLGFLSTLKLPKFSRLTKFSVPKKKVEAELDQDVEEIPDQVFPPGLDLSEIFPLLQHLQLRVPWTHFFPHEESLSRISNLKSLKIPGDEMTKEDIFRISGVCPNLKELKISNGLSASPIKNFPEVGTAIWTHLTKLVTLNLKVDVKMEDSANPFRDLDSCFTGFSGADCTRLREVLIEAEISSGKKEQGASQYQSQSTSKEKSQLDAERKNPSILNLKDLRNLTVVLNRAYTDITLIVSEKYAFQLMENLNYKVVKSFNMIWDEI